MQNTTTESFSIEIEATTQQVWAALTSQERLRDWFNPTTTIEARQGGHFTFEGVQGDAPYQFVGEISAFETKQEITARTSDAVLSFAIAPGTDTDTTVVELRHSGFDALVGGDVQFWGGDELIPLRELVTGVGPTH